MGVSRVACFGVVVAVVTLLPGCGGGRPAAPVSAVSSTRAVPSSAPPTRSVVETSTPEPTPTPSSALAAAPRSATSRPRIPTPRTRYSTPHVDVPHVGSPLVTRDRNGRCHDARGRFTRCPG